VVAGTSAQLTSNKFVYTISYGAAPSSPVLDKVAMEGDSKADVWQTPRTLTGTATGTDLGGGTIAVSSLEISSKPATVSDFIEDVAGVPSTSTTVKLNFQLKLVKPIPDGSKVSFMITTKSGDTTVKSNAFEYVVSKPTSTGAKPAAVSKPKGTSAKPASRDKPTKQSGT